MEERFKSRWVPVGFYALGDHIGHALWSVVSLAYSVFLLFVAYVILRALLLLVSAVL